MMWSRPAIAGVPAAKWAAMATTTFALDSGTGPVHFQAAGETSPCAWMDDRLGPGARDALRGRGGLRAEPTSSGRLRVGPVRLVADRDADLDPTRAGDRVRRGRRLP